MIRKKIKALKVKLSEKKSRMLKRARMKISDFWDQPLQDATEEDLKKVEDFKKVAHEFDIPHDGDLVTDADRMWNRFKREMRDYILQNDPRTFLRCKSIIKSISVPDSPYGKKELRYLQKLADWKTRWMPAIEEDKWGYPYPYWCYQKSSGTRIHHAYHIALFEEITGRRIDDHESVIEFGGGYGNMPRLLNRLGYNGKYLIYDFKEFAALQHFYLTGLSMSHGSLNDWVQGVGFQCSVSNWSDFDIALEKIDKSKSMFMATWSLSEAPFEIRAPMLERIKGAYSILIAYQSHFEDLANVEYFLNFQKNNADYDWYNVPILHIPGHYYLFGAKK